MSDPTRTPSPPAFASPPPSFVAPGVVESALPTMPAFAGPGVAPASPAPSPGRVAGARRAQQDRLTRMLIEGARPMVGAAVGQGPSPAARAGALGELEQLQQVARQEGWTVLEGALALAWLVWARGVGPQARFARTAVAAAAERLPATHPLRARVMGVVQELAPPAARTAKPPVVQAALAPTLQATTPGEPSAYARLTTQYLALLEAMEATSGLPDDQRLLLQTEAQRLLELATAGEDPGAEPAGVRVLEATRAAMADAHPTVRRSLDGLLAAWVPVGAALRQAHEAYRLTAGISGPVTAPPDAHPTALPPRR